MCIGMSILFTSFLPTFNIIAFSLPYIALEFIYAQSPDNMKGLLIGFQYFLIGVWAAVKAIITIYCNSSPEISKYYYWGYFGLGFVGLCVFMIISSRYRNRKRNNPITDIMRISSYY